MKRRFFIFFVLVLWLAARSQTARADIVEIKGEGFANGDVVSEDEKEVRFRGPSGEVRVLARKDVLSIQKEQKSVSFGKDVPMNQSLQQSWTRVKNFVADFKDNCVRWTDNLLKRVTTVDRSQANAKAAALDRVMQQAGDAAAALNKKNLNINHELKNAGADSAPEEKKSRYASL